MTVPLWQWSATSLAEAIRAKQLASQDVVRAHLDRIRAVNDQVNAITVVLEDDAVRAARTADQRIADGDAVGPLHGVPITVKENIDLVGSATTHGLVDLKDSMPATDAPVVAHLKAAGAIPIGRTNLPDLGMRWHTDNDLWGATRNPWDPARTPGGSSGGEAVALATGMSPLGVGNDVAGSLRYPAQCCGITAVRPTLGRVSRNITSESHDPPTFHPQVAWVNGPMARHVRDLRLALEVMRQPDPTDPWWTPAALLGATTPGPVHVALTTDSSGPGGSPAVVAGVQRAADVLANAGYEIEEIDPPALDEAAEIVQQMFDTEIQTSLSATLPVISWAAQITLEAMIGDSKTDLPTYLDAIARRYRIAQDWGRFMERYPLVLGPISTLQPFEVGFDLAGREQLRHFMRSIRLTEACSLLGLPSVAVPVDVVDGLPQAVQLIGPRYHEDLCFDAAETIERHCGVLTPIEPRDGPSAADQARVPA